MANRERIGIIGAGWVSEFHLNAWQAHSDRAEIVAIVDPDEAARTERAAQFAVPRHFARIEDLLDAVELDAVDICAPREVHTELVRVAARTGCAVLCQKPLGRDLSEARELVDELGAGPRLMVHENWRFRPHYRQIGSLLRDGVAGDMHQVELEFFSSGMIPDQTGQRPALVRQHFFRALHRLLVMEVLIHHMDTLRFLLGELEVLNAWLTRTNDEIVGEDVATLQLQRKLDEVPVHIAANFAVHGAPPLPAERLRIFGSRATIELNGNRLNVCGRQPIEEEFDCAGHYQQSYTAAIEHFLDCLETGAPFETCPQDNLKTLELVEMVYKKAGWSEGEGETA